MELEIIQLFLLNASNMQSSDRTEEFEKIIQLLRKEKDRILNKIERRNAKNVRYRTNRKRIVDRRILQTGWNVGS